MRDFAVTTKRILCEPGLAGVLVSAFVLGVGFSFVSPFLSLWGTQEIGLRPVAFGAYMTTTSLAGILVATTLARWSDSHVPRKVMLLLGGAGGLLGYTGYALLHDPRGLLAVGVTLLALATVCFSQLFAHVRERFGRHDIPGVPAGFLMSVVRVCFSVAWTAGPSVGAWMKLRHGFQGLFLGAATLFGLFFVGVLLFVPFEPKPHHLRAAPREPVWRVLTRGDVRVAFAAFLLILAAHTINAMNLPLMLTQGLGGSERDVGIAFGIGPVAEIPLMLWFGLLAGRGHAHQLGLIRFGAAATVGYFLLLVLVRAPWQVFPLQVLHGLSFAIVSNVGILFFQDLVPGQPGLATTLYTNAGSIGNLVGYLSFGTLMELVGNRGLFGVSAALTVVALGLMLRFRRRAAAA